MCANGWFDLLELPLAALPLLKRALFRLLPGWRWYAPPDGGEGRLILTDESDRISSSCLIQFADCHLTEVGGDGRQRFVRDVVDVIATSGIIKSRYAVRRR